MQYITVEKKDNGFLLSTRMVEEIEDRVVSLEWDRELVVEGKDPKKLGEAVLKMFEKPRGPRKKVSE